MAMVGWNALRAGYAMAPYVARGVRFGGQVVRGAKRAAPWAAYAGMAYNAAKKFKPNGNGRSKGADNTNSTYTTAGGASTLAANVTTTRGKRRRFGKKGRYFKRRQKRFRKKVWKVIRGKNYHSWLSYNSSPPAVINVTTINNGFNASTTENLDNGFQYIMGASKQYGLLTGPAWNSGTGLELIFAEHDEFTQDINGVPITQPAISGTSTLNYFVNSETLKLTFENTSSPNALVWAANDLSIDIYEFVAVQDINQQAYRTPVEAWNILADNTVSTNGSDAQNMSIQKGATPLSQHSLGKWWRLVGKTRVNIPYNSDSGVTPHQTLTYKVKNKFITTSKWEGLYAKKGVTRHLLIIIDPDLTSNTRTTTPPGQAAPVTTIWNRHDLHYKCMPNSGTTTAVNQPPNQMFAQITGSVN